MPLEALGQALGVATPITSSLIDRARDALGRDFRSSGRKAATLNLVSGMPKQIVLSTLLGAQ